jgi:hypothetical protein
LCNNCNDTFCSVMKLNLTVIASTTITTYISGQNWIPMVQWKAIFITNSVKMCGVVCFIIRRVIPLPSVVILQETFTYNFCWTNCQTC